MKKVNIGDFRQKEAFFEVELNDLPEAVMIFSIRSDFWPNRDGVSGDEIRNDVLEDNAEYVYLSRRIGLDNSRIVNITQVHGSEIVIVNENSASQLVGDAIITDQIACFPSIKTADCQATLILDPVRKITAAIHAGWRGTVQRITRKVVLEMQTRFGCRPADLIASLGPSIGTCCYEVDEQVLEPFRQLIPDAGQFIEVFKIFDESKETERLSSRIDLRRTNRHELILAGIHPENIRDLNLCTQCNEDMFYSYRRDGSNPGRLIALAGFKT